MEVNDLKINDLFLKNIDRNLEPVVKTGVDAQGDIAYDLDEYIVTNELADHLRNFYENYAGINAASTENIGVWIRGYYGCGKSYFLKILSYLLENPLVNGESAVTLFTKGDKIKDNELRALIQKAGHIPAKVVSFDITTRGTTSKPVLDVLIGELNSLEGFCKKFPFIAEIERQLTEDGLYEDFKTVFAEVSNGNSWEISRERGFLGKKYIVESLAKVKGVNRDEAAIYLNDVKELKPTPDSFARAIKRYCEAQGPDFRLIFLIDELGPYIADKEDEITSLQAIVISLGTICKGKAWIAVTTLEDINNKTRVISGNLSRIQARFNTRISLSSENVEEIIRERLLKKKEAAQDTLKLIFESEETSLKNLLQFTDETFKDYYQNNVDFAKTYPFAKYQFNLARLTMQQAFDSGATGGDNLSQGERSLLYLFSHAVRTIKDKVFDCNTKDNRVAIPLVPYDAFYSGLEDFLTASYAGIIAHAKDNGHLNDFDVRVLKVLLMVKNIPQITATLENIATLVIDNLDTDRNQLEKDVKKSLDRLVIEKLISRNGSVYVFLSNEEREVDSRIDKETVEEGEIIQEIKGVIFDEILSKIRNAVTQDGRYQFGFNPFIDDTAVRRGSNEELSLKIITELKANEWDDDKCCTVTGAESNQKLLLIKLKTYEEYTPDIRRHLQIEKYLQKMKTQGKSTSSLERIKEMRSIESDDIQERYTVLLKQALEDADYYVGGGVLDLNAKEAEGKVKEALSRLIETAYSKLSYMDSAVSQEDILAVLSGSIQSSLGGDSPIVAKNVNAISEMNRIIRHNANSASGISLKSLTEIFSKIPYGYNRIDVSWLVAVLFNEAKITLKYHNKRVSLDNTSPQDIAKYLTEIKGVDYPDSLLVEIREETSRTLIDAVRDSLQEIFGVSTPTDIKEDVLISTYVKNVENLKDGFEKCLVYYQESPHYPGKKDLDDAIELMRDILVSANGIQHLFFKEINEKSAELGLAIKKGKRVVSFFTGSQLQAFKKALSTCDKYERNKTYLDSPVFGEVITKITNIIEMELPYGFIKELPQLIDAFAQEYQKVLDLNREKVIADISAALQDVLKDYDRRNLNDASAKAQAESEFDNLRNNVNATDEIVIVSARWSEISLLMGNWTRKWVDLAKKAAAPAGTPDAGIAGASTNELKVILVKCQSLMTGCKYYIESEDDIDDFVETIRENLKKELEKGDAIQLN